MPHLRVLAFVERYLLPDQTYVYRQMTGLAACEVRFAARHLVADCTYPTHEVAVIGDPESSAPSALGRRLQRLRLLLRGEYARLTPREDDRVRQLIRNFRPDVVHAHWAPDAMLVAPACVALGVPLVVQLHGYDASTLLTDRVYRRALHRLLAQAAVGLTVSDDMRTRLLARGFAASKLRRHYIGVPDEILGPGPRTRRTPGTFRLLQVGRLAETKGHRVSLAAIAECRLMVPSLSLQILGEGPMRAELEAEHQRLSLGAAVQFVGRRPPDAVLEAMREADALLAPSERDATGRMEGLPIVIAEALAAGLPVIATLHAGIPEAVRYSAHGWLTPEGDASAVADRIRWLASDAALWNRCSREGWEWTDREFRLSRQCDRLEAMYAALTLPAPPVS